MKTTIRLFTKRQLVIAANKGVQWDFNRRINLAQVKSLPDCLYPVTFSMLHEHRAGYRCEPHMRCEIFAPSAALGQAEDLRLMVDVPLEFWESLTEKPLNLSRTKTKKGNR